MCHRSRIAHAPTKAGLVSILRWGRSIQQLELAVLTGI